MAYLGMSRLALRTGELDEALELAERAYSMLDLKAERMAPHGQAMMLAQRGRVHVVRGELEPAQRLSRQAVELAISTEDMPLSSIIVEAAAEVLLLAGDPEQAARTMGMATVMRGMRTVPDTDVRNTLQRLHDALGNEAFDTAFEAGAALTREEAVNELRKRVSL